MKRLLIYFAIFIAVIILFSLVLNYWIYPDGKLNPEDFYFENSQTLKINGYKLHYQQEGEKGPPVLMIPANGSSSFSFRNNIKEIAKTFKVYALDVPPFGLSEKAGSKKYSEEKAVELVIGFMNKIEPDKKFNIIASSSGGRIATAVAARYPKKVSSLTLIDSYGLENADARFNFIYKIPILGKAFFKIKMHIIPGRTYITSFYQDPLKLTAGEKEILFQSIRLKGFYNAYLSFTENPKLDGPREIGALSVPVLIVWGKNDRYLSTSIAEKMKVRIKGSELFIIEKTGHVPHEEKSSEFNQKVIEFLQISSAE